MSAEPPEQFPPDEWAALSETAQSLFAALIERIAELERRLGEDSSTSSRPPSSDPPWKRRQHPQRKPSGRRPGGQSGHEGRSRTMPADADADHLVDHLPGGCERCGRALNEEDEAEGPVRRHAVWELVARPVELTVHRAHGRRCRGCRKVSRARLPAAEGRSAFGPRLRAALAGLVGTKHLSRRETVDVAGQVLGVEVSPASVQSACEEASELLRADHERVLAEVRRSDYVCIDETGWRHGRLGRPWLWVGVAPGRCATFSLRDGRGAADLHSLIGEHFSGVVSCDGYTAYRCLPEAERQQCLAHLTRKFRSVAVHDRGRVAGIGREIHSIIEEMMAVHRRWRRGEVGFGAMSAAALDRRPWLLELAEEGAALGVRPLAAHCRTMLARLDEWFTFARHEGVDATNNAAERALRHSVIDRKVKLHTWSDAGRRFVERMASLRATATELGCSSLAHLTALFEAAHHGRPAPMLLGPG